MEQGTTKQWPLWVSLFLAAAGVLTPIIWDFLRSSASLELKQVGQATLIQGNTNFEKLRIEYDGKVVKELASLRFTLANTGSKPIRDSDLISPPSIHFPKSHPVLDSRIEDTYPENLLATIQRSSDQSSVNVGFPLLNPGDNFQFVVLLANSTHTNYRADARIVGVTKLKVVSTATEPARASRHISWFIYPVAIFLAFLVLATIGVSGMIPSERRLKDSLRRGTFSLPDDLTAEEAKFHVNSQLSWTTPKERTSIMSYLATLPSDRSLHKGEVNTLEEHLRNCARAATSNVTFTIFAVPIILIGAIYIIFQIRA